ncbi:unnamed protein product [Linum trigynum]|uniref:Uncharacterized protein n=1 Tax=Linum trigynum TaxID=586398 RepID=A0AAV2DQJ0_9ROSI
MSPPVRRRKRSFTHQQIKNQPPTTLARKERRRRRSRKPFPSLFARGRDGKDGRYHGVEERPRRTENAAADRECAGGGQRRREIRLYQGRAASDNAAAPKRNRGQRSFCSLQKGKGKREKGFGFGSCVEKERNNKEGKRGARL